MALQRSVTVNEQTYPEAYSRILQVRIDKMRAHIFTLTYADKAARDRKDDPILIEEPFTVNTALYGNVFELAYTYLKTLPEFAGAIDVFEPADVPTDAPPAGDAGGAA